MSRAGSCDNDTVCLEEVCRLDRLHDVNVGCQSVRAVLFLHVGQNRDVLSID